MQYAVQNDEDPKIAHNVAVAEYYLRGSTNPSDLLDALAKIRCGLPPRPRPAPLGTAHAEKCRAPRPPPAPSAAPIVFWSSFLA